MIDAISLPAPRSRTAPVDFSMRARREGRFLHMSLKSRTLFLLFHSPGDGLKRTRPPVAPYLSCRRSAVPFLLALRTKQPLLLLHNETGYPKRWSDLRRNRLAYKKQYSMQTYLRNLSLSKPSHAQDHRRRPLAFDFSSPSLSM